jgi:hypothetical protein
VKFLKLLAGIVTGVVILCGFLVLSVLVVLSVVDLVTSKSGFPSFGASEILVTFIPIWAYMLGWLVWGFSDKRRLGQVYPWKALIGVLIYYIVMAGIVLSVRASSK